MKKFKYYKVRIESYHSSSGFYEGPVHAVHFVVQPTGVTQVVPCAISPPQRGGYRPTVHTFPAFCHHIGRI